MATHVFGSLELPGGSGGATEREGGDDADYERHAERAEEEPDSCAAGALAENERQDAERERGRRASPPTR
jgi:hypothetical protein